jgi:hypothetical protein
VPGGLPHAPAAATAPRQPPRGDGFVDGSRVSPIIVDDIQGARINELLGGVKRGALVLIVGAAGAGKSTATAELAGKAAEHWARPEAGRLRVPNCPVYWLDADQRDPALVRECWINGGVDHVFTQPDRIRRLDERPQPYRLSLGCSSRPDADHRGLRVPLGGNGTTLCNTTTSA